MFRGRMVRFSRFARAAARALGSPIIFFLAVLIVLVWAVSGPLFGFNDSWQLTINTVSSLVTFLMVFLLQSSQNRDSEAMQLKLDELIRAAKGANNALASIEELTEEDLARLRALYRRKARLARHQHLALLVQDDRDSEER